MEERNNMWTFRIVVSSLVVVINFISVSIGMWENNYPKATFFLILLICSACWLIGELEHK